MISLKKQMMTMYWHKPLNILYISQKHNIPTLCKTGYRKYIALAIRIKHRYADNHILIYKYVTAKLDNCPV